jgi:exopolysaccharide biosynthesis polyprenyl glycosylphosphotransferase
MATPHKHSNRAILLALSDILLTLIALHLASWGRYVIPWGVPVSPRVATPPWQVYALAALIWPLVLSVTSSYRIGAYQSLPIQVRRLAVNIGLALLVLAGALYLSFRWLPRRLFLYFGVIDFLLLVLLRTVDYASRRNGHTSRLLVAGAGRVGSEIGRQVRAHNGDRQLVGFLDDDPAKLGRRIAGVPVLGSLDALEATIVEHKVTEVVFALPLRAHERLMRLVIDLEQLPVEVSVVPDYFDLAFFRTRVDELFGFPLIRLRASAIEGGARVAKRLFDLAVAVPCLVVCLPFLPLIALAIRIDSPGVPLIKQERVGENCQRFRMWKFRTMVANAEQLLPDVVIEMADGQVVHKHRDDPRVTRVGGVLRRYSIDELPQLVNVIKGEMSLVGPRPELPWMVDRYEGWQRKRFAVPPGLTGWWQVSGRSERPMHLHVEDDLYYIQNYSIWLDLHILYRTVGVVLSGRGAY